MSFQLKVALLHAVFFAGLLLPAQAALQAVAGLPVGDPQVLSELPGNGDARAVAVNLANGFPVWYQDENALRLQLCLDTGLEVAPGVLVNPCEYEPPTAAPPSFPGNFGAEAMYWTAAALGNYVSSNAVTSSALLVLALEAGGANEAALTDGNQAAFSRIRIRIDVPVAGTYRVTHPYGTIDYIVTTAGADAIDATQDSGLDVAQNFLAAMNDGTTSIVNADGATIGPFLVPATPHGGVFNVNDPATFTGGPITAAGATYIALPFAPNPTNPTLPIEIFQPVSGSPFGTNFFRIELLDPPVDFQLNPADPDNPQRVQFDNFLLVGKIFNAAANAVPLVVADAVATAMGRTANIDVVRNDTDDLVAGNAHGINPQALVPVDPARLVAPFFYTFSSGMPQLTATRPTTEGGSVRRVTSIPTGRTTFLYTPPGADFAGTDSFQYVVQDSGGLISAPATVTVTVEKLQIDRADYRPRFGKWHLSGSSSDSLDNAVTLYAGPRARLSPEQEVQIPAVTSTARGNLALRLSDSAVEFFLAIDPLPVSTVTAAHIHAGAAGTNGPIIFSLYASDFGLPFAGSHSGTLTAADLQPRPANGITSFSDAVDAILSGNAYINLHTTAFPAGEIRGQILRPVIGRAPVADGLWQFSGHSLASPGALPGVSAESDNGVRLLGAPLRLR